MLNTKEIKSPKGKSNTKEIKSPKGKSNTKEKSTTVGRELEEVEEKVQKVTYFVLPALFVLLFAIAYVPSLSVSLPDGYCRKVIVYHWEEIVDLETTGFKFSYSCEVPLSTLLYHVNKAFRGHPKLTVLLAENGDELPDVVDLSLTSDLIKFPYTNLNQKPNAVLFPALAEGELFIWPAEIINRTITKLVGPEKNHLVSIKSVSKEPRIFEVFNLMTPEEADHFYNVAKRLEKSESTVGADTASSALSQVRTSSTTWMGKENNGTVGGWHVDAIINLVENKIFELTRLDQTTSEPFQVVFYDKDQFYYGHHDYTTKQTVPRNPYFQGGGNRFVTVLLYLNDVEEGGETAFPFVDANGRPINRDIIPAEMYYDDSACSSGGVMLKPKKGGAAMFYNLKENGHMDGVVEPYSLHSGCRVLKGEKYITNKWLRNKRVKGKLYDEHW